MRRIERLLPALAIMLVSVSLVGVLAAPLSVARIGPITGVSASLFSSNAFLSTIDAGYFDPAVTLNPLLHTWTVGVEEQFYLVFPLLLLAAWRMAGIAARDRILRPASRTVVPALVVFASVASFAIAVTLPPVFAFYAAPSRAWEFGAGALVAFGAPALLRMPERAAWLLGGLGFAAIVASTIHIDGEGRVPVAAAVLPVAGTCALLAAGTVGLVGASRILATRGLTWIGDLFYSWYLWHWPLIVFAAAVFPLAESVQIAAAAASLLPAWLSYRYVENRVRLDPRIRGRNALALAAVCIAAPALACSAWLAVSEWLSRTAPPLAKVRAQRATQRWRGALVLRALPGHRRLGRMHLERAERPRTSGTPRRLDRNHADRARHAFGKPRRLAATVATLPGCAFVALRLSTTFQDEASCRDYYEVSLRARSSGCGRGS